MMKYLYIFSYGPAEYFSGVCIFVSVCTCVHVIDMCIFNLSIGSLSFVIAVRAYCLLSSTVYKASYSPTSWQYPKDRNFSFLSILGSLK